MDYSRKANGAAKDAASVYTDFIKQCGEKGIELDSSDKRTINIQIRSLHKKLDKKLFKMKFDDLAQELSSEVSPLFNYLNALSGASFLEDIQNMDDAIEKSVAEVSVSKTEEDSSAENGSADKENDYIDISPSVVSVSDDTSSAVAQTDKEEVSDTGLGMVEEESVVEEKTAPAEKITSAQAKTLDALSRIRGMRGGKVVDAARKREIAREINSLKVQRDTRTRNISMKAEDMAVLTSILEYAETKEGKEKQFLGCDMDKWNGIFHAAIDCLLEKLCEENRHGYLNAIANGQEKLHKKQAEIDEKINKLLAEKEGF